VPTGGAQGGHGQRWGFVSVCADSFGILFATSLMAAAATTAEPTSRIAFPAAAAAAAICGAKTTTTAMCYFPPFSALELIMFTRSFIFWSPVIRAMPR
jgi:hypothetical protein